MTKNNITLVFLIIVLVITYSCKNEDDDGNCREFPCDSHCDMQPMTMDLDSIIHIQSIENNFDPIPVNNIGVLADGYSIHLYFNELYDGVFKTHFDLSPISEGQYFYSTVVFGDTQNMLYDIYYPRSEQPIFVSQLDSNTFEIELCDLVYHFESGATISSRFSFDWP